jgi:mannose-6-phosphate isomerase
MDGMAEITYNEEEKLEISKGETILVPATVDHIKITPKNKAKLLEVYIESENKKEEQ